MSIAPAQLRYTPADVDRLTEQTGKLYELVGGELVEKPSGGMLSNYVTAQVVSSIQAAGRNSKAYVFVKQLTHCFADPCLMRRPDVAMIWAHHLPGGLTDEELAVAPDLAVEVASPANTFNNLFERVREYLEAGVSMVWIVDPQNRWVHLYRRDGSVQVLRGMDTLKDEPLLPGLVLRIADFFPPTTTPMPEAKP